MILPSKHMRADRALIIAGERNFRQQRGVTPPVERTAPAIADSDASDDE